MRRKRHEPLPPEALDEPFGPPPEEYLYRCPVCEQNLENLRRNHYAPLRRGSPCVTSETNVMCPQGAQRCAPSKATFPLMRSRP